LIDFNHYKSIIYRKFPDYEFSWEILTKIILQNLKAKPFWADIGAGPNILINEQPGATFAIGIDLARPDSVQTSELGPYALASIYTLPFCDSSFDFITSRYTFEHLAEPELALTELQRILKPGGRIVIQTTNKYSPTIILARLIPFALKKMLFKIIFKDNPSGTFKTYYKINSPGKFPNAFGKLILEKKIVTEEILCQSKLMFGLSFTLFRLISLFKAKPLFNNIIVIYQKLE
jgi:SAM-dependent methyltransferase